MSKTLSRLSYSRLLAILFLIIIVVIANCEENMFIECGNGVLEGSEECDDGNIVNGDGCSSACILEACDSTVDPNSPLFDRFEGTAFANSCVTDAHCLIGGCSGEVCAAEPVVTTCEALPELPSGSCGCIVGQCIWNECASIVSVPATSKRGPVFLPEIIRE